MKIIGDFGSCHMARWEYIQEAIDLAKEAGVDIIKFQLFKGNEFSNIEFPRELWPQTVEYARKVGIDIFASVFDIEAIKLLEDSGIKKAKLAYSQNFNLKLIRELNKRDFEIWASGDEDNYPHYADIKLFCVPEYPPKKRIDTSYLNLRIWDGFSSHLLGIKEDIRILQEIKTFKQWEIIEKHFTLDHDDIDCPDHWFALLPKELKAMGKELKGK